MNVSATMIAGMEKLYRTNFVNSLPGFKSACLIGTVDRHGSTNLAIFSSVVHIGAHPPLMGFILRPTSVPRHTYAHIRDTGVFTINHVHAGIHAQAHQTSARYPDGVSEFDACGLTPEYTPAISAPYVGESRIRIGLEFVEEVPIQANNTLLIIGGVVEVIVPDALIRRDGTIDIEGAETVAVSALDGYHTTCLIERLSYAKPDRDTRRVPE
jgi:flavin reductase (DIM6/NTAB) family NADH-FMN oxidoreductase RutF